MDNQLNNYLPSRSDVMKRAWQIKRNEKHAKLGQSISLAWREVKNGDFGDWHHLPIKTNEAAQAQVEKLKMDILALECKDRWNENDYSRIDDLRSKLSKAQSAL